MIEAPLAQEWQADVWFNSPTPPTLAVLRGTVVLLHAFHIFCPACVSRAVPQAERVHRDFAGEGVSVIGLHTIFEHHSAFTPAAVEAFVREYDIRHPIGMDSVGANQSVPVTVGRYEMAGTPSLVLIDRAGRLRLHEFGSVPDLDLGVAIGRLLQEDHPAQALKEHAYHND